MSGRMAKISAKDWRKLPLEDWNVSTFHAYLIDMNKEKYGIDYVPFGKGSVGNRWRTEQGQLKNAQKRHGNEVLRRFIDLCFETHKFNPKFPTLSFGFIFSYKRNELAQAQAEMARSKRREESAKAAEEVGEEWF